MKSTFSKSYNDAIAGLISARKKSRILQVDLAEKLGKPQSFISKYERCERRLDIGEFIEVCRALGVNPVALLHQAGLVSDEEVKQGVSL